MNRSGVPQGSNMSPMICINSFIFLDADNYIIERYLHDNKT